MRPSKTRGWDRFPNCAPPSILLVKPISCTTTRNLNARVREAWRLSGTNKMDAEIASVKCVPMKKRAA